MYEFIILELKLLICFQKKQIETELNLLMLLNLQLYF